MTILKKIADACTKEATSWQSNIQALHKAKQEEQKAVEKAKEKELKLKEKEAEREKSRKEKAEQKLRKEAEATEAASTQAQAVAEKGKKRRRTVGVDELTNEDPRILREMSRFSGGSLPFLEDLRDFAKGISHAPLHVLGCRLKRSCVKRALQVFWLQVNRF